MQVEQTILGLLCVSLRHQTTDGINAICCRKHNRAKPMFDWHLPYFSIADAGEFGSRGFILSVKRCH